MFSTSGRQWTSRISVGGMGSMVWQSIWKTFWINCFHGTSLSFWILQPIGGKLNSTKGRASGWPAALPQTFSEVRLSPTSEAAVDPEGLTNTAQGGYRKSWPFPRGPVERSFARDSQEETKKCQALQRWKWRKGLPNTKIAEGTFCHASHFCFLTYETFPSSHKKVSISSQSQFWIQNFGLQLLLKFFNQVNRGRTPFTKPKRRKTMQSSCRRPGAWQDMLMLPSFVLITWTDGKGLC